MIEFACNRILIEIHCLYTSGFLDFEVPMSTVASIGAHHYTASSIAKKFHLNRH